MAESESWETAAQLAPAAEAGRSELKPAYDRGQESLRELDQAYATGWAGLSREAIANWQDTLLPSLGKLGGERRRFLPRSVKVALWFVVGLLVIFVLFLILTDQLGQVIQFE